MLDNSSRKTEVMHSADSAPDMLRQMIAADRAEHGLERAMERVARACEITYRRARSIWHRETKRLWAEEDARIREAYAARLEAELKSMEARREAVRARLEALRSTHESTLGELRALARTPVDQSVRMGGDQG